MGIRRSRYERSAENQLHSAEGTAQGKEAVEGKQVYAVDGAASIGGISAGYAADSDLFSQGFALGESIPGGQA